MTTSSDDYFSISPQGVSFPLPQRHEYETEFLRIRKLTDKARSEGKEIVIVMGLDFSATAIAATIADSKNSGGSYSKFVICCQRPSTNNFWKIPLYNEGNFPVEFNDPIIENLIYKGFKETHNLIMTYNSDCLSLADCTLVNVHCDLFQNNSVEADTTKGDLETLELTIKTIGKKISPYCLVLIAPGTTKFLAAYPILKIEFDSREIETDPLLAYNFKKLTPEINHASSINNFWSEYSGCNDESKRRLRAFIRSVYNSVV